MKRFIAVIGLSLVLASCAQTRAIFDTFETATSATVSSEAVILAASSFDAVEITATNYLRLRRCTGTNGPLCRDPGVTKIVIPAVQEGRKARNSLKAFARSHPNALGPQGTYDALVLSTQTIKSALSTYQIVAK